MPTHRYQQVADTIRARIRDGTYPPGSALPLRRDLREEFGVSDIVVNSAMRILRNERLVETLHGVGVYVVDPLPPPQSR
jgi:DNA-binding GntR family transcriptional regulator